MESGESEDDKWYYLQMIWDREQQIDRMQVELLNTLTNGQTGSKYDKIVKENRLLSDNYKRMKDFYWDELKKL